MKILHQQADVGAMSQLSCKWMLFQAYGDNFSQKYLRKIVPVIPNLRLGVIAPTSINDFNK